MTATPPPAPGPGRAAKAAKPSKGPKTKPKAKPKAKAPGKKKTNPRGTGTYPGPGRPPHAKAKFDRAKFEGMLAVSATREMCAIGLGISDSTLDRVIPKEYGAGVSFEQLAAKHSTNVTLSLRQRVLRGALNGDRTLLIFASKTMAGLRERVEFIKDPTQHADDVAAATAPKVVTVEDNRMAAVLAVLRGARG
jgi:hypothetical protein